MYFQWLVVNHLSTARKTYVGRKFKNSVLVQNLVQKVQFKKNHIFQLRDAKTRKLKRISISSYLQLITDITVG